MQERGPLRDSWTIVKKLLDVRKIGMDFERIMERWRREMEGDEGARSLLYACKSVQGQY